MSSSSRSSIAFLLALALLAVVVADSATAQTFSPSLVSGDVGNITVSFGGANLGDYVFLYDGSNCSGAPYLDATTWQNRTAHERLRLDLTARMDVSKLVEGTYHMCYSTTGEFPSNFTSLGTMKVLYTIFVSPSPMNIDQGNVTVRLQHSLAGRSVFLLLQVVGGVKTDLNCGMLPGGIDMVNRSAIVPISGDLTATLDIAHLVVGEYTMCYSDSAFVSEAATPFASLPQTVHLMKAKICAGGGTTGICHVSPSAVDMRSVFQTFYLYPARPRTHAYLLRKDVCGTPTYGCSDNRDVLEATGYATPVGRVGFDRRVTLNISTLVPGTSYVVCHLNVSADVPPSFVSYAEVTATSITVSGGPDPTQTVVSCCAPSNTFVAGTTTTCTVYTYDVSGLPTGIQGDECTMLGWVTDPNGGTVCASQLRYLSMGRFEFDFNATVAGKTIAATQFLNNTGGTDKLVQGSVGSVVSILPAAFDDLNSISACARVGAVDVCDVTNRDSFGNDISMPCQSRSDDTMLCNGNPL